VIAVAAAVGGIIGGFTVYAVDSALTWPRQQYLPQRPDVRADNQSGSQSPAAVEQQKGPVRIVGGAIPDPSAGMSAPPPAQRQQSTLQQSAAQQNATQQNPAQWPPQLLAAKPLGPPTSLQAPATSQPQAASAQQSTRLPDALSREQQGSPTPQQQTMAPAPNATAEPPTGKTAGEKNAGDERAVGAVEDRGTSRRGRHGRRLDARAYDRLYNSYGYARERDETGSRYDAERRYGRYSRHRSRSREIVPDRQDIDSGAVDRGQGDRERAIEAAPPRAEPFWGGGYRFRYGGFQGDD
jgi:hypothetical protein